MPISLNNLAALLQDTNRRTEMEPLMRRTLVVFLRFTAITGHVYPYLEGALRNYYMLGLAMEVPVEDIGQRMFEMGEEAGMSRERMAEIPGGSVFERSWVASTFWRGPSALKINS